MLVFLYFIERLSEGRGKTDTSDIKLRTGEYDLVRYGQ